MQLMQIVSREACVFVWGAVWNISLFIKNNKKEDKNDKSVEFTKSDISFTKSYV